MAMKSPDFSRNGRHSSESMLSLATARAETAVNFSRYSGFAASSSALPQTAERLFIPRSRAVSEMKFTFFPVLSSAVTVISGRIIANGNAGSPAPLPTSRRRAFSGIYFAQAQQSAIFITAASCGSRTAVRFIYVFTRRSSSRYAASFSVLSSETEIPLSVRAVFIYFCVSVMLFQGFPPDVMNAGGNSLAEGITLCSFSFSAFCRYPDPLRRFPGDCREGGDLQGSGGTP